MSNKISRRKAEAALAAVKAQYAAYFQPIRLDDNDPESRIISEGWPEPVLVDRGHRWDIVWEEGPDEWVFTLDGGSGEESRVLAAQAAREFGGDVDQAVKAVERPAAKMPAGVYVEAVNHVSIGLYPA